MFTFKLEHFTYIDLDLVKLWTKNVKLVYILLLLRRLGLETPWKICMPKRLIIKRNTGLLRGLALLGTGSQCLVKAEQLSSNQRPKAPR